MRVKGLVVKSPWIDLILEGKKTWEIRSSNTTKRGKIALIKSGSGCIYGTIDVVNSFPIDATIFKKNQQLHQIKEDFSALSYKKPHAWVFANPILFEKPIPYTHPQGAVIWVNLDGIV